MVHPLVLVLGCWRLMVGVNERSTRSGVLVLVTGPGRYLRPQLLAAGRPLRGVVAIWHAWAWPFWPRRFGHEVSAIGPPPRAQAESGYPAPPAGRSALRLGCPGPPGTRNSGVRLSRLASRTRRSAVKGSQPGMVSSSPVTWRGEITSQDTYKADHMVRRKEPLLASSTTPRKTRSRKSGNDGATVRNRAAAPAASTTASEDVGTVSKHDKRVDTLKAAVAKATKSPVGLKDSTMSNRLILTIGGATAAWLWLSRGQLNAASSRTGLDEKGVGVNRTMAQVAAEIVKRNSASPGRGAGKAPAKAATPRKTTTRKRGSGGKAPANGGDLTSQLQETVRRTRQSGSTSGGSRQRRRSR